MATNGAARNWVVSRSLAFSWVLSIILVSPLGASSPRSTTDRTDDVGGNQIHLMYVVPSDGVDRALDTNGTIEMSAAAFERWFEGQSGGRRLRIDRYQGQADVTFFRLGRTDAQIASHGAFVRDEIEADLIQAGFNHSSKIYAVYYDGRSTFSCGGGFWPPTLPGKVVALYLKGDPPGFAPCSSNVFASSPDKPGYWEFSMIHEIFHGLGVVAICAPHHTRAGHVSDDPRDLMYAGDLPWQPSILDVNHDDYFGHGNPGCLDLEDSVFLEQAGVGSCVPSPTTLCVDDQPGDRRFQVDVAFRWANGSGAAKAIPLASLGVSRGGLFWFFSQDNPELMIKILNGCALNDRFWIFYAAGTNVELTVTATDTVLRATRTYRNPLNVAAPPVQDTSAFPCH